LTAIEETSDFQPRFDSNGLIPVIVIDAGDGAVLMFAWMNAQSLKLTQDTGEAHFWSRSRQNLWRKGETSGQVLHVREMWTDCDQDVLLIRAEVGGDGGACHTGRRSCFYRRVEGGKLVFAPT
jgi:phosphoribosyl-AMP cyclohydrolase